MLEKLMQERRKEVDGFDVIDFVDEAEIQRIRGRLEIDAPMSVSWQWEYGSEVGELRALYEKGKANQWNATADMDWDLPLTTDGWVLNPQRSMLGAICQLMGKDEATCQAASRDELNYSLSQLLHGEQAALHICGQLTNLCPKMDEKWYAASQVADEARHVEVFARLLSEKFGTIYPIAPTVKLLLDKLLAAEGYAMKTLGMQTLFEGIAVGVMDVMRAESRSPLLSEVLRRVQQDEARHAAFGVLVMRRVVRDASQAERERMEDWSLSILEALNANQQLDMLHTIGPKYGLDPMGIATAVRKSERWPELNSQMYMHTVLPNLMRLGLLTERTEDEWRSRAMLTGKRGDRTLRPRELLAAS
jgi:1,2-phenylacetyl-CoA epoxidase catalytic subunit